MADVGFESADRIDTGLGELNRVLGGGLVPGSVVLVGGEPGVGKSTLLLQALLGMEARGVSTLLVSGEESAAQVKLRSVRLGGGGSGLRLITETQTEAVVAALEQLQPSVCVVDSVQTLWSAAVGSTPGSVAQIREVTAQLLQVAKTHGIALILVGHVTKDGELAGPRVLEHMVDAVLSFEGDRAQPFRILRAVKNRFGSTNEVGVFQMAEQGLVEVSGPGFGVSGGGGHALGFGGGAGAGRHALPPGRGAGPGGAEQSRHAAARGSGGGSQPAGHDRGRAQPPCAAAAVQMRHFC